MRAPLPHAPQRAQRLSRPERAVAEGRSARRPRETMQIAVPARPRAARRAGVAHDGDAPERAPVPAEEAVRPARDGPAEGDRPRARYADHAETREGAAHRRGRARARHLAEAPVGVGYEDARRAVVEHGGEREPAPAAERDVVAEASEAAPPGAACPT